MVFQNGLRNSIFKYDGVRVPLDNVELEVYCVVVLFLRKFHKRVVLNDLADNQRVSF